MAGGACLPFYAIQERAVGSPTTGGLLGCSSARVSIGKLAPGRWVHAESCCDVGIERTARLKDGIDAALAQTGPILCEVMLNPENRPLPRLGSRKKADGTMESNPLQELVPLVSIEEFGKSMIVKPYGVTP